MATMKPRRKRLLLVLAGLAAAGVAATLVVSAFRSNLVFFFTPSQIAADEAPRNRAFRIGGLVEAGSLHRDGTTVRFLVTDTAKTVPVTYVGILPDLFREGKGVVAQGRLESDGVFHASEVLAKHDENYMPPEAAEALKRARGGQPDSTATLVMSPATETVAAGAADTGNRNGAMDGNAAAAGANGATSASSASGATSATIAGAAAGSRP
jgi:cytochrome c-type biogenesis protein CcmE